MHEYSSRPSGRSILSRATFSGPPQVQEGLSLHSRHCRQVHQSLADRTTATHQFVRCRNLLHRTCCVQVRTTEGAPVRQRAPVRGTLLPVGVSDPCQKQHVHEDVPNPVQLQGRAYQRILTTMIRSYVDEDQTSWCVYAPFLCFSYNMTTRRSTGTSSWDLLLSLPQP